MIRRLVMAMVLASVAVLPLAQAAAAARPTIERDPNLVFEMNDVPCDGLTFDILLHGREIVQDFGDRVRIKTLWQGTVEASDGTKLRVLHSYTETFDLVDGTLTVTGIPFGTRVEQSSLRVHDRGRLVLDLGTFEPLFVAGKFSPGPPDPVGWTCSLIEAAAG